MTRTDKVAVCSRSFPGNSLLRAQLLERYERVMFNDAGLKLAGSSLVEFLTARGGLLDEAALALMVGEQRLAAASFDGLDRNQLVS